MIFQDTYHSYKKIKRRPIQYTYCVDYKHISRYRDLRQVIHEGQSESRYVALETVNPFVTSSNVKHYAVPTDRQDRLDLIAQEQLGSAHYAWVIAYINRIQDGFSVTEGTDLMIPTSFTSLFEKGEILAPIEVTKLNLGSE